MYDTRFEIINAATYRTWYPFILYSTPARRLQHEAVDVHVWLVVPEEPAVVAAHAFAQCRGDGWASRNTCLAMDHHRPDIMLVLADILLDFISLFRRHQRGTAKRCRTP